MRSYWHWKLRALRRWFLTSSPPARAIIRDWQDSAALRAERRQVDELVGLVGKRADEHHGCFLAAPPLVYRTTYGRAEVDVMHRYYLYGPAVFKANRWHSS